MQHLKTRCSVKKIAESPRVLQAVRDAIAQSDENVKNRIMGPSRSQLIRHAIAETLNAV